MCKLKCFLALKLVFITFSRALIRCHSSFANFCHLFALPSWCEVRIMGSSDPDSWCFGKKPITPNVNTCQTGMIRKCSRGRNEPANPASSMTHPREYLRYYTHIRLVLLLGLLGGEQVSHQMTSWSLVQPHFFWVLTYSSAYELGWLKVE